MHATQHERKGHESTSHTSRIICKYTTSTMAFCTHDGKCRKTQTDRLAKVRLIGRHPMLLLAHCVFIHSNVHLLNKYLKMCYRGFICVCTTPCCLTFAFCAMMYHAITLGFCTLRRQGVCKDLTNDHTYFDEMERERVVRDGGTWAFKRCAYHFLQEA